MFLSFTKRNFTNIVWICCLKCCMNVVTNLSNDGLKSYVRKMVQYKTLKSKNDDPTTFNAIWSIFLTSKIRLSLTNVIFTVFSSSLILPRYCLYSSILHFTPFLLVWIKFFSFRWYKCRTKANWIIPTTTKNILVSK